MLRGLLTAEVEFVVIGGVAAVAQGSAFQTNDLDGRGTFSARPILTLRTSEGELDLLDRVAGLDGYDASVEHSDEVRAFGLTFRALELHALIRSKEATGRAKDLGQPSALRTLLALREGS